MTLALEPSLVECLLDLVFVLDEEFTCWRVAWMTSFLAIHTKDHVVFDSRFPFALAWLMSLSALDAATLVVAIGG